MGIHLALASGRTDQGLRSFAEQIDMQKHHGIFVCYNGAKVIDCQTGEVYYDKPMSVEEGKAVLEHMKKFDVIPIVARGEYMYTNDVFSGMIHRNIGSDEVFNVIQYESRSNGYILCEKKDLASFADFEIEKILTAGDMWQKTSGKLRKRSRINLSQIT